MQKLNIRAVKNASIVFLIIFTLIIYHFMIETVSHHYIYLIGTFLISSLFAIMIYQHTLYNIEIRKQHGYFKEMADMLPEMILELRNDRLQHWPINYMNNAAMLTLTGKNKITGINEINLSNITNEQCYNELNEKLVAFEMRYRDEMQSNEQSLLKMRNIQF